MNPTCLAQRIGSADDPVDVIDTSGTDLTRIIAANLLENSLSIRTAPEAGAIEGVIDGNRVDLRSGAIVLEPLGPIDVPDFDSVVSFDRLIGSSTSYQEDGLQFDTTGNFVRDDATSPALRTISPDDTVTLTAVGPNALSVYSLDVSSGPFTLEFEGVTRSGATVLAQFAVPSGPDGQRINFPHSFRDLISLSWVQGGVKFDNFVLDATPLVPVFTVSSSIRFDTNSGIIASGSVLIDDDRDGQADRAIGAGEAFTGDGLSVVLFGDRAEFEVDGDLVFPDGTTITATGPRALSLSAANDVVIGMDVLFDVSAAAQNPGPGGGSSGSGGLGGSAWGDGGPGGVAALRLSDGSVVEYDNVNSGPGGLRWSSGRWGDWGARRHRRSGGTSPGSIFRQAARRVRMDRPEGRVPTVDSMDGMEPLGTGDSPDLAASTTHRAVVSADSEQILAEPAAKGGLSLAWMRPGGAGGRGGYFSGGDGINGSDGLKGEDWKPRQLAIE